MIKEFKKAIQKIVVEYDVRLLRIIPSPLSSKKFMIELDHNIYYKAQERMEKEIRALHPDITGIDIYYKDVV